MFLKTCIKKPINNFFIKNYDKYILKFAMSALVYFFIIFLYFLFFTQYSKIIYEHSLYNISKHCSTPKAVNMVY